MDSKSDDDLVCDMVNTNSYNPLDDTRPYYYATYDEVRGTTQLYDKSKLVESSVLDSNLGDEFQMNSRIGQSDAASILDKLNSNTTLYTTPLMYKEEDDGGRLLDVEGMNERDKEEKKQWTIGESAGINFDLPTEAQWEYCCRQGSTSAIPPDHNLGENFEENDEVLDLIAWYKYKVLGTKPEPERYCSWRISKMLFGISKDKEQINNVYEKTDW